MKLLKNQTDQLSLNIIKGGRNASESLDRNEFDLLREMTNAFQVVYGGQFKSRHHSKLA